jgi:uncharacterized protein involved in exopolysaccharide biosynthesis
MTRQYELARVQETKDIPPIRELDVPQAAERHSFPHRIIITIVGMFLWLLAGIAWIIGPSLWKFLAGMAVVVYDCDY